MLKLKPDALSRGVTFVYIHTARRDVGGWKRSDTVQGWQVEIALACKRCTCSGLSPESIHLNYTRYGVFRVETLLLFFLSLV